MQFFSEETKQLVMDTLRDNKGDIPRTAHHLGMSEAQIRWVDVIVNKKFDLTVVGKGRPELQPYIVAIRDRNFEPVWDNDNPKIIKARELYDEGVVELTTGIDGDNMILYAIPRRFKDIDRLPYFSAEEEEENV